MLNRMRLARSSLVAMLIGLTLVFSAANAVAQEDDAQKQNDSDATKSTQQNETRDESDSDNGPTEIPETVVIGDPETGPTPIEREPAIIPSPNTPFQNQQTAPVPSIQNNNQQPNAPINQRPVAPSTFPSTPLPAQANVTASPMIRANSQTGSSVSVINQQQIQQSGQSTIAEVLRGQLGVDVVRQGGPGGVTSLFLRGANSQHTKVLLDGISINDPSNATRGFDFSTLAVDNIERIEVLRGPQSVLYGSDAIGGVINIITKRGSGPLKVTTGGMGGSFGTARTNINASGGTDDFYYSLGGIWLQTDGISSASAARGNTERDAYRNGSASGRFGWTPGDLLNVDYVFRYNDIKSEVDDFDFFTNRPVDNLNRENLSKSFFNRLQLQSFALDGLVEHRAGFNLTNYDRVDTDPGPFSPPRFEGETREVDYVMNLQLTEANTLSVGANYLHEEASSTFNPLVRQTRAGVFVNDQFNIGPNWFNSVGVRWDDNNLAGPANTYRATSVYQLPAAVNVHGAIGTGFRAPALAESLFAFGNPGLSPERSRGWEAGIGKSFFDSTWNLDATYFRNDFRDLIVFDFTTFALANVGRARTSGVELTSTWLLTDLTSVTANYTFTDTVNLDTDTQLLRRARNKAALGISRAFCGDCGHVGANVLYVDSRLDTGNNTLDPYVTLNLTGSYRPRSFMELTARIDNVTDQQYEEVFGYGVPGIGAYGGVNLIW